MAEHYRCYFISRDGKGRSLASIVASDPMAAIKSAIQKFPLQGYRYVEVWHRCDRVFACEIPATGNI